MASVHRWRFSIKSQPLPHGPCLHCISDLFNVIFTVPLPSLSWPPFCRQWRQGIETTAKLQASLCKERAKTSSLNPATLNCAKDRFREWSPTQCLTDTLGTAEEDLSQTTVTWEMIVWIMCANITFPGIVSCSRTKYDSFWEVRHTELALFMFYIQQNPGNDSWLILKWPQP